MGDCQPSVLRLDTSRIPSLASLQRCGAHRPFSDSNFHFQNNRSLNLLGVWSSERYRCKADGLYFHFCNFVFVTETFFCAKNWGNQTCLTKSDTRLSTIYARYIAIWRYSFRGYSFRGDDFFESKLLSLNCLKFWRSSATSWCRLWNLQILLQCGGCYGCGGFEVSLWVASL